MFLSKRSNGIYYIFYDGKNGKRTCLSTKCKKKSAATIVFNNFINRTSNSQQSNIMTISLKDFVWEYLKFSELYHTTKTTKTYKTTFNSVLKYFGNLQLSSISPLNIDNYINNRIKHGSIYSDRKDIVNIKASFKWAVAHNYLQINPAEKIKKPKCPEVLPKYYSEIEFNQLLSVVDNIVFRNIIQFAVNTGLRQSEIINLKWSQADILRRRVILDNHNHITKTKKIRLIPLNKEAIKVLKDLNFSNKGEYVFMINNDKINQDYLIHKFKKSVLKANINPKLNFHSLRHTFASWLVQRGVSIYEVSKLLGHSNIKTTEIYAHLTPDNLLSAVEKLNQ